MKFSIRTINLVFIIFLASFYSSSQTPGGGVIDIDGNNYNTVIIGNQEWMAENLNVSTYNNGDSINHVQNPTSWSNLVSGAWSFYDNAVQYENPFGKLYNGYSVVDPRGLCPIGWHVPSESDWDQMINFLGGETIAGGQLKDTGTYYWVSPNNYATNISGFTGLPGGIREYDGTFGNQSYLGAYGHYWTCTEDDLYSLRSKYLWHQDGMIHVAISTKKSGYSIRCISNSNVGQIELEPNSKELLRIINVMGQETTFKPNTTLIYIYSDGTTKKTFTIE